MEAQENTKRDFSTFIMPENRSGESVLKEVEKGELHLFQHPFWGVTHTYRTGVTQTYWAGVTHTP